MNFKRLLTTPMGKFFLSVVLGLGLATLFRKVCTDKDCIVFQGPIIGDFENKTYKQGDKCYQFSTTVEKCDASSKKIIDIRTPPTADEIKAAQPTTAASGSMFGGIFGSSSTPVAPAPAPPAIATPAPTPTIAPSATIIKMSSI